MWKRELIKGLVLVVFAAVTLVGGVATTSADDSSSILTQLKNINVITSTVPANGDINPYGIVEVKNTVGGLHREHILISNFNNMANQQGGNAHGRLDQRPLGHDLDRWR